MLVKCRTLFNQDKYVPAESLVQRPSVYGVVIHDGQLLVAKGLYTGLYMLPGGGIHQGEAIEAALIREIREETSIEVEVGEFLYFTTDLFYYDPLDQAFHGFLFFYRCAPLTTELHQPDYPPEEGLEGPLWVAIADLQADQFQARGELTMEWLQRLMASS